MMSTRSKLKLELTPIWFPPSDLSIFGAFEMDAVPFRYQSMLYNRYSTR